MVEMTKILVRFSSCLKISVRSSNKQSKSMNTIWIMRERWGLNFRINLSSSKMSSVENKYKSHNLSSKSIICFIKIRTSLWKINASKVSLAEWKNSMVGKSNNYKPHSTWKLETFKKPLFNTILSSKNLKNKGNNMLSNWLFNFKEK